MTTDDHLLIEAYQRQSVPLEALAYTAAMGKLAEDYCGVRDDATLRELYRRLCSLKQRGFLPRIYGGAG